MSQKILIVDDDDGDRHLIKMFLSKLSSNLDFIMAESGEQAVEYASKENPFLTILDTNLTGINGFQACERIKNLDNCQSKIIIITGIVDAVDAVKARKHGADDYCAKSEDCEDIIEAVKNFL